VRVSFCTRTFVVRGLGVWGGGCVGGWVIDGWMDGWGGGACFVVGWEGCNAYQ